VANAIDDIVQLRTELDTRLSRAVRIRGAADVQLDRLRPGSPPEGAPINGSAIVASRDAVVLGAHADVAWRISRAVEITPGLRAEVYASTLHAAANVPVPAGAVGGSASPAIDPRIAARVKMLRWLTAVSTFGVSHQLPGLIAQYPQATPFLQPGVLTGLQSSVQASQGVEIALPANFSLTATGFLHDYGGIPDVTACAFSVIAQNRCVTPAVNGRAYGLELLFRRAFTERFSAWLSYTLSHSTRQAHSPVLGGASTPFTQDIVSEYDRTHVLSAAASYDVGRGWRLGGRFFAYSGRPYTAFVGNVPAIPFDSERLPGFFRLDARVEKMWQLGAGTRLSFIVEGANITLNKETVSATCGGPTTASSVTVPANRAMTALAGPVGTNGCTFDTLGPITIPSIGVEGSFR
jgi:hypothetical protein